MAEATHPLLKRAQRFSLSADTSLPSEFRYDVRVGAWVHQATGELLVECAHFGPRTKKGDIETGEDEKGE